jgi:hypothetical protein
MRPVRTTIAVMFAAAIAVTGCTARPVAVADHPSSAPPATHPTHPTHPTDPTDRSQPRAGGTDPARVDQQTQIYAAVLRQYLTSGDAGFGVDYRFPWIFVLDHAVAGAGAPGHGAPGGGPIPPTARRAITRALTDVGPLTFVASGEAVIVDRDRCASVRDHGILVTLGPVDRTGDSVQVGLNGFVACLGANSLTYLVRQSSGGWVVSGITALGPVA